MTCRQVVQLLNDYLEGMLPAADRQRVEEHLAGCEACAAFVGQLRASRRLVARLAEEEVPASVKQELLTAFRNWRPAGLR
jgi:anti-sigma factor RsiW